MKRNMLGRWQRNRSNRSSFRHSSTPSSLSNNNPRVSNKSQCRTMCFKGILYHILS
jgi:hypothetical protein